MQTKFNFQEFNLDYSYFSFLIGLESVFHQCMAVNIRSRVGRSVVVRSRVGRSVEVRSRVDRSVVVRSQSVMVRSRVVHRKASHRASHMASLQRLRSQN